MIVQAFEALDSRATICMVQSLYGLNLVTRLQLVWVKLNFNQVCGVTLLPSPFLMHSCGCMMQDLLHPPGIYKYSHMPNIQTIVSW